MYQATTPWQDAEIAFRAQRIKNGTSGARRTAPRSGRRRRHTHDSGSWETWRSPTLAS
jgi:hypothetical protein